MLKPTGKPVRSDELIDLFPASEGGIQAIIGMIRSGKTTEAVRRMRESLANGRVVYSNILLDLSNERFDDRESPWFIMRGIFTFKRRFFVFDKKNYHYFDPRRGTVDGKKLFQPTKKDPNSIVKWLNTLTDCEIYYDEGQRILNSYEGIRVSSDKLDLIEETGHVNRLIVIITQRSNRIHVNARANVNQFFYCSKGWSWLPFLVVPTMKYRVTEFQAMIGNEVDTTQPVSQKSYTIKDNVSIWRMFNTHYLRDGRPISQKLFFSAYDLSQKDKISTVIYWSYYRYCQMRYFISKRLHRTKK